MNRTFSKRQQVTIGQFLDLNMSSSRLVPPFAFHCFAPGVVLLIMNHRPGLLWSGRCDSALVMPRQPGFEVVRLTDVRARKFFGIEDVNEEVSHSAESVGFEPTSPYGRRFSRPVQ